MGGDLVRFFSTKHVFLKKKDVILQHYEKNNFSNPICFTS